MPDVTYFAETNFRNQNRRFGMKRNDRTKHTYIIGKSGMGKTTLLENMAAQDIMGGEGLGIIDPHGDFAEKMLKFVPKERINDVLYFAPHDMEFPIGFNVMENVDPTQRHLVANGLMGVFKKIWPDVWSARMEYILSNCILALLEYPDSTILGINRMLSDKDYRKRVVDNVTDVVVKSFWVDEFAKYSEKFMTEAGAAIQNKIGQLISNPLIRNIIGQSKSTFDIREVLDGQKIFIMNLSKGRIGEENSRLIGAMLITKIYLAAMSRVNIAEKERKDFYLYVDEFQNFATESFKDILSEARKYRLSLILAHQYIAQMDETVRDAVIGNVGTMISFRVGAFDAEVLEKEFSPEFYIQDIVNLGFAQIYLKLLIDGVASRPFSATTLAPIKPPPISSVDEIIAASRAKYSMSREAVDRSIQEWHKSGGESPTMVAAAAVEATAAAGRRATDNIDRRVRLAPTVVSESDQVDGMLEEGYDEEKPKVELFDAECAECGKSIKVPFKPDGVRPVYCPTHRKQAQQKKMTTPQQQQQKMPQMPRQYQQTEYRQQRDEAPQMRNEMPQAREYDSSRQERLMTRPPMIQKEAPVISTPPSKTISLRDLEGGFQSVRPTSRFSVGAKREPSEKQAPKMDELRQALQEIKRGKNNESASVIEPKPVAGQIKIESEKVEEKKAPENSQKSGVIKPGEKVQF